MKKLEDLLRQLQDESDERLLEVAKFAEQGMSASAVIHEVRQPLTALSMALQMALESARRGDTDMVDIVEEAIRLAGRTEMLLDRARDFLSPSLGRSEIDVAEAIERVVSVFQWHIRTADNVNFDLHIDDHLAPIVGDRGQVEQAVANLISNAIDAVMSRGRGTIHILARSGEADTVEIIVADNGTGIPDDVRDRIFQPFFSTKARGRGTGLGLYIVQRMAEDYRGGVRLLTQRELDGLGFGRLSTGFVITLSRDRDSVVT